LPNTTKLVTVNFLDEPAHVTERAKL